MSLIHEQPHPFTFKPDSKTIYQLDRLIADLEERFLIPDSPTPCTLLPLQEDGFPEYCPRWLIRSLKRVERYLTSEFMTSTDAALWGAADFSRLKIWISFENFRISFKDPGSTATESLQYTVIVRVRTGMMDSGFEESLDSAPPVGQLLCSEENYFNQDGTLLNPPYGMTRTIKFNPFRPEGICFKTQEYFKNRGGLLAAQAQTTAEPQPALMAGTQDGEDL